jgi:hypothetical protein
MSKEAKQAIQYAEKLKSANSLMQSGGASMQTDAPMQSAETRSDMSSLFSGMTPWQQDGFNEGVKMGNMSEEPSIMYPQASNQAPPSQPSNSQPHSPSNPAQASTPAPLMPASQFYPRSYPYKNDSYPIPVPVPEKQFPRLEYPFHSPIPPSVKQNPILYPPTHESFYSPPSAGNIAQQLTAIQMELARLRSMDERSSYAMEEFVICVGMGVGLLLLLDKISA